MSLFRAAYVELGRRSQENCWKVLIRICYIHAQICMHLSLSVGAASLKRCTRSDNSKSTDHAYSTAQSFVRMPFCPVWLRGLKAQLICDVICICRSVPYVLSRSGTNDQRLFMYVVCMCSDFDNFNKGIDKLLFLLSADRRRSQMNCVSGRGAWDDELQYRFRDLTTGSYYKAQWLSLIVRCSECYFSVVVSPHCIKAFPS